MADEEHEKLIILKKMCMAIVGHNEPLGPGREKYFVRGDMFRMIIKTLEELKEFENARKKSFLLEGRVD